MPFNRPTLKELVDRSKDDINANVPGAAARLRRSILGALATMVGGASHSLRGAIDWLSRQFLTDTMDADQLDRVGGLHGIPRLAATFAVGEVDFTGTDGVDIPAGTVLRLTNIDELVTDDLVTIAAGAATANVTASTEGLNGNAEAGEAVSLVSPIAGISAAALVAAGGLTGGADEESNDRYRLRLGNHFKEKPHGGADWDYVKWAKEADVGVTRAWVYGLEDGAGTVTVRFVMDDKPATIIPDAGEVAVVDDYIALHRPVTANVTVEAPTPIDLDLTIDGLDPDTNAVQAAVTAELTDLLKRDAEPGGTILLTHIAEAISIAAGEHDHALTLPAANVTHLTGEIAVLGTITWT